MSSWPSHEDISGSALAITNLVHTYDLDPDAFAKGRILETQTTPLEGEELLVLADEMYHHNFMHDAHIWINRSIARLEELRSEKELLKQAHYKLREIEEKVRKQNNY